MLKKSFKVLAAAVVLGPITTQSVRAYDDVVGVARVNNGTVIAGEECEGGTKHCHLPFAAMVHPNGTTYSPGHGFRRYEVVHIQRNPVEYRRYWPSKWYGEPGSAIDGPTFPMVYTPTDTTQLGYYYQRVPTWRPNPGMIPPPPRPSEWHRREIGPVGYGYGEVVNGTVISTTPVPSGTVTPSTPAAPAAPAAPGAPQHFAPPSQPVVPPAAPAVPPAPQALNEPEVPGL